MPWQLFGNGRNDWSAKLIRGLSAEAAAGFQSRRGRWSEPTHVNPHYAAFATYKTAAVHHTARRRGAKSGNSRSYALLNPPDIRTFTAPLHIPVNVPNWPDHVTGDEMVAAMDKVGAHFDHRIFALGKVQHLRQVGRREARTQPKWSPKEVLISPLCATNFDSPRTFAPAGTFAPDALLIVAG